jgi:light-regulated signal transduction histidine kinase (bacteriophytochrome)
MNLPDSLHGIWEATARTGMISVRTLSGNPIAACSGHWTQLSNLVHPDDFPNLKAWVVALIRGDLNIHSTIFRLQNASGGWNWVQVAIATRPAHEINGDIIKGLITDISEIKAREKRLAEGIDRVNQFASAVSHDLQAPLRHISLYANLLASDLDPATPQPLKEMLEAIETRARDLQSLVKKVISFATATAAPQFDKVDLTRAVGAALEKLEPEISGSTATVIVSDLPQARADRQLMEKVFYNIVLNALVHSLSPAPEIMVRGFLEGRDAVVDVTDNAGGVDPAHAGRIFDAFWSLPRPTKERRLGMGLTLAKAVLLALNGDITLASSDQNGSVFRIRLPAS